MKLLRTIRLDPSDTFVFERAAEPGEWAVSGAFAFAQVDATRLEGKARAAYFDIIGNKSAEFRKKASAYLLVASITSLADRFRSES